MLLRFSTDPAGAYGLASVRQRLRNPMREDTGGALPAVLLFIVAIGALVGSVLAVHQIRTRLVQQDIREVHLEYASEAALARLVADLHRGPLTELQGETLPCPSRALMQPL